LRDRDFLFGLNTHFSPILYRSKVISVLNSGRQAALWSGNDTTSRQRENGILLERNTYFSPKVYYAEVTGDLSMCKKFGDNETPIDISMNQTAPFKLSGVKSGRAV
jgi:hypothetical protein